jgi:hypothetical protein
VKEIRCQKKSPAPARSGPGASQVSHPERLTLKLLPGNWGFAAELFIGEKERNGARLYERYLERTASMSFSIVPMLLVSETIPVAARQALKENRLRDGAEILMREFGLSCIEAGDLLDVSAC